MNTLQNNWKLWTAATLTTLAVTILPWVNAAMPWVNLAQASLGGNGGSGGC